MDEKYKISIWLSTKPVYEFDYNNKKEAEKDYSDFEQTIQHNKRLKVTSKEGGKYNLPCSEVSLTLEKLDYDEEEKLEEEE